ncbi:MAG: UvrB/UvrC motif-containing protein [Desulfovibrio sp.]|nr:UvrB/UvrC motif-containing protein [Desulfovibrio sp.]
MPTTAEAASRLIAELEKEMRQAARDLEFEQAASLRDRIKELRARMISLP